MLWNEGTMQLFLTENKLWKDTKNLKEYILYLSWAYNKFCIQECLGNKHKGTQRLHKVKINFISKSWANFQNNTGPNNPMTGQA